MLRALLQFHDVERVEYRDPIESQKLFLFLIYWIEPYKVW